MMPSRAAPTAPGASTAIVSAQDNNGGPAGGGGPGGWGGPGGHPRHPPLPIVMALDTNHDGVIDSNEIANAPAALKSLDKNGDGQLTADEYLPPLPKGRTRRRAPSAEAADHQGA